ncbi:MAG: DUF3275 family protein [Methylococcaceae bacterium]
MISVPGCLAIKIINGRHGAFRVGNLKTEIGEFAVKDKILDQYDEGSYEGLFDISKIFSSTYSTGSRLVVEVRAVLENIALANAGTIKPDQFDPLEQDPLDEEQEDINAVPAETESTAESDEYLQRDDDQQNEPEKSEDETLFGLLWPLQETFKLDPTVDRAILRLQRERLKAIGYRFVAVGQYWVKH